MYSDHGGKGFDWQECFNPLLFLVGSQLKQEFHPKMANPNCRLKSSGKSYDNTFSFQHWEILKLSPIKQYQRLLCVQSHNFNLQHQYQVQILTSGKYITQTCKMRKKKKEKRISKIQYKWKIKLDSCMSRQPFENGNIHNTMPG